MFVNEPTIVVQTVDNASFHLGTETFFCLHRFPGSKTSRAYARAYVLCRDFPHCYISTHMSTDFSFPVMKKRLKLLCSCRTNHAFLTIHNIRVGVAHASVEADV